MNMLKTLLLTLGLASVLPSFAQKVADTASLRQDIMTEFAKHPEGYFAVALKDFKTGETFYINEHDLFHAASTMKTPVMIETYKQVAAHKLSLDQQVPVHIDFKSIYDGSRYQLDTIADSEHDLYSKVGSSLPLSDLLYRMITKSSNLATNLVIEIVGAKNVNATMRSIGAKDIQVLRGVEDSAAFNRGMNNMTTAFDLALIMEHIARGNIVNRKACEDMIRILLDQYFKDIIAAKLPADVKVASKSGSITAICHDSGIVFLPDGTKYVVVLLSRGIQDHAVSTECLATVSRLIYDHVIDLHQHAKK